MQFCANNHKSTESGMISTNKNKHRQIAPNFSDMNYLGFVKLLINYLGFGNLLR